MRYYAVIDTNVLVSAMLKWNSVPGSVMELVFGRTIIPLYNDHILNEYREVLARPKFCLTQSIIDDVVNEIKSAGVDVDAAQLDVDLPDPKDRVFYEVVMEKRETGGAYLVTGNIKHFPAEPFIVTPRQMLDIVIDGLL